MPNELIFYFLALVTTVTAIGAMSFKNLVHCGISLIATFVGLAAIYMQLNAQFVGFAQILVYAGAVGILVVFAILLTRGSETTGRRNNPRISSFWGVVTAGFLLCALVFPILSSNSLQRGSSPAPVVTVKEIGLQMMSTYVVPLQAIGLLLTAALLGGVIIAMRDGETEKEVFLTKKIKTRVEHKAEAEVEKC